MSTPDSRTALKIRRDGWTPERQLRFLQVLSHSRSVTRAAAAVGMSRESAHRLRARLKGQLFALAWHSIMGPRISRGRREIDESHIAAIRRACGPEGASFVPPARYRQFREL